MKEKKKSEIRAGFQSGFSIALGFIPIAMTFGILAKSAGISLWECVWFSSIVYAGASQFMAVELLKSGAGIASIVFTTLLFNFRHFIMGASMSTKLDEKSGNWRPLMAFWMTDETYSIAYLKQERIGVYFYLPMAMTAYLSFSFGSFMGFQLGSVLPPALGQSMGVALYAMFLAILTPEIKKSIKIFGVVATSGMLNILVHRLEFVPMGWHIIIVIVLTVGIWTLVDKREGICEVSCCE